MNYKKLLLLVVVFVLAFSISLILKNTGVLENLFATKTTVKFAKEFHNFGELKKEKGVYFRYTNQGKNSFKITNISSACGCTVFKWSRKKLKPKQTDSIFVSYDARTPGYFSKAIYIFSNSKTSPDVLYIKGYVKP